MHFKPNERFCTYFKDLLLHKPSTERRGKEKNGKVRVGLGDKGWEPQEVDRQGKKYLF